MCPDHQQQSSPGHITDSPWFWLLVFANVALLGAVLIAPKYSRRQLGLERKFEARREIAHQKLASDASSATVDQSPEIVDDDPRIAPLMPLLIFLLILNLVAMVLFCWRRVRHYRT